MRSYGLSLFPGLVGLLLVLPVCAEGNLVGHWSGTITAVLANSTSGPPSPFAAIENTENQSEPRFIDADLKVSFEEQKDGLAFGKWATQQSEHPFVCAQLSSGDWDCIDANARATFHALSDNHVKVCYLNQSGRRQIAACGELTKSK